jgi:hypothetical protein
MPAVPQYEGPQVRRAPLPGPMQDAGALSVQARANQQFGQAVQGLGDIADKHVERELQTQAEAAANNADSEVSAAWLEWDAKARQQYRGTNVGEYATKAKEWWDKAGEEYGQKLDRRAKALVGPALQRKRTTAIGGVLQYSAAETERHADDTYAANVATSVQFGITTGDVAGAAEQVRKAAAQVGARKGWDTKQVQAEQLKNLSNLHLAHISKLAERDAAAASAYYQANKEEIGGVYQAKVEDVLKAEGDNQFAVKKAAELASLPLGEQLAAAAKIGDPKQMEKTITRIKEQVGLKKMAQQEREQGFSDQAWQLVGQSKKVPESVLTNMDGKERVQLQDYLQKRAEHLAANGNKAVKTDPRALAKIYDMMRDDPEGFKKQRMEPLMLSIGASDMEQIARVQRDMLKPDSATEVATSQQQMSTYTGGFTGEKRATFEGAALSEFFAHQQAKGKPPTFEERRAILDRLVMDGEVRSGAWYKNDPNKAYYQASPEERKRFVPSISSEDRAMVVQALVGEGVTKPTDAQIIARFKLAKGFK